MLGHALGLWGVVGVLISGGHGVRDPMVSEPELPAILMEEFAGYSLPKVSGVAFDSTGCVWLATQNGAWQIDGQRVRRYGREDGLSDLYCYDVVCGPDGTVYVGTWRGLCAFRDGRFWLMTFPEDPTAKTKGTNNFSPARSLVVVPDGRLWASTDGLVLRGVEPGGKTFVTRAPAGLLEVPSRFALDSRGRLWQGYWLPGATGELMTYCMLPGGGFVRGTEVGAPAGVREMGFSSRGLWLQTVDGAVWAEEEGEFHPARLPEGCLPDGRLLHWFVRDSLHFLVGESAVVRWDERTGAVLAHRPTNPLVRGAALDSEGSVWCPVEPAGVIRVGTGSVAWYRLPPGVLAEYLAVGAGGVLWAGSKEGVHCATVSGGTLRWSSLRLPEVSALEEVGGGMVMVGTVDGAWLVRGPPPRVVQGWTTAQGLPSPVVTALASVDSTEGWIGTARGACRWVRGQRMVWTVPRLTMAVTALLPDDAGIWIGTWAGLWHWKGGQTRVLLPAHTSVEPAIGVVSRDPLGRVVAGTFSDGLMVVDGDGLSPLPSPAARVLGIFPRASGWPYVVGSGEVLALEPSGEVVEVASLEGLHEIQAGAIRGEELWLATRGSVERVMRGEYPVTLTRHWGLPPGPFTSIAADSQGMVWVATEEHLCQIDPEGLGHRPVRGRFSVSLLQGGQSVPISPGARFRLPTGMRTATLQFHLPYFSGGQLQLRTRLAPLEAAWTPWTKEWGRQFGALPPGAHELYAQARTSDGRLTEETLLAILVVPPLWHERTGVRVAGGILLVGLGVIFGLSRVAAAKARARKLEQIVAHRTKELDAARAKAVEDGRAKSVLLSRMAHELRTPLGAMMGFADLIAEAHEVSEEAKHYARVINEAGQRLLGLIKSILDLSKAQAAVAAIARTQFDLASLVREVVELLSVRASEKGQTLVVSENGWPSGPVWGDPDRLREVLINLVGNAVKYTPEGGTVRVGCHVESQQVAVSVQDNGPGISPEDQKRLFEPFVRLGSRTSTEAGCGLGLTISKQLVEAMGGTITVHSAPGEGTTFTVTLPLA